MNKFAPLAALATLATFSLLPVAVHAETLKVAEGKMIYSANGQRIAPAYHVNGDGSVQVILDGQLLTIPADHLSDVNGKVTASDTRASLMRAAS